MNTLRLYLVTNRLPENVHVQTETCSRHDASVQCKKKMFEPRTRSERGRGGNGDLNSEVSCTLREAWSHLAWSEVSLTLIVLTVTWTLTEVELFAKPGRT